MRKVNFYSLLHFLHISSQLWLSLNDNEVVIVKFHDCVMIL